MAIFRHVRDMAYTTLAPPIGYGMHADELVSYSVPELLRGTVIGQADFAAAPDFEFLVRTIALGKHPDGDHYLRVVETLGGMRDEDERGQVEFFDTEQAAMHAYGQAITRLSKNTGWKRRGGAT